MSEGYNNTNSGALFKNEKKHSENSPDYRGSAEPVCAHCGATTDHWISMWKKVSKKGSIYLSLAFNPKDEQGDGKAVKPVKAPVDDLDEDIPF